MYIVNDVKYSLVVAGIVRISSINHIIWCERGSGRYNHHLNCDKTSHAEQLTRYKRLRASNLLAERLATVELVCLEPSITLIKEKNIWFQFIDYWEILSECLYGGIDDWWLQTMCCYMGCICAVLRHGIQTGNYCSRDIRWTQTVWDFVYIYQSGKIIYFIYLTSFLWGLYTYI